MLQAYGHFKLVPSHLAFRFYRLACWWALSLGFCDSSNKSSTLEHKRTASLYRIALPLSLISHWLTPTVFVSVSRSDRLACASCLCFDTLIVQWQDQCLLLASLSLEQYILFSFFFFSNKDLFLSSRAVDLPTLLLLYRSEFLFILLFLVCGFYFPLCFHFPCLEIVPFFFTRLAPCSNKKVDLIPQLGSICLGVMVTSWIFLPVALASFAGQSGG